MPDRRRQDDDLDPDPEPAVPIQGDVRDLESPADEVVGSFYFADLTSPTGWSRWDVTKPPAIEVPRPMGFGRRRG